jgi:hypothetical protein
LIAYNIISGGEGVSLKVISPENDVIMFLKEIKEVLTDPNFDVSKDLDKSEDKG